MFLFKGKAVGELDSYIFKLEMNMSHNYKDNAQEDFKDLCQAFKRLKEEGKLKDKTEEKYSRIISEYESKMKEFTHKDQKPYWT